MIEILGVDEGIEKLESVQKKLAPRQVRLDLSERSTTILTVHASRGRDALSLTQTESDELAQLVSDAMEAPAEDASAMWDAAGSWYRELIAEKVRDLDLVDSGELLEDVESAAVILEG